MTGAGGHHLARGVNIARTLASALHEPAGSVMPPLPEADSGVGPPPSFPARTGAATVDSVSRSSLPTLKKARALGRT